MGLHGRFVVIFATGALVAARAFGALEHHVA